jgi:hypothetical protein
MAHGFFDLCHSVALVRPRAARPPRRATAWSRSCMRREGQSATPISIKSEYAVHARSH